MLPNGNTSAPVSYTHLDVYKRQDAYNPKTKIPLKILVNKFMISAYSFKRVTILSLIHIFPARVPSAVRSALPVR